MRKKIVAGNWKMNLLSNEAIKLAKEIDHEAVSVNEVEVIIFPPSLFVSDIAKNTTAIKTGVQNFYPLESGAFTGENSIVQIKDSGATWALIGHSERRAIFGETQDLLKQKVDAAIKHNIGLMFCCGESLDVREKGEENVFVKKQLQDSLFHLTPEDILRCAIAYEPVWAIGTGRTASAQQAEAMHFEIRSWISEVYGQETADQLSILYGGSCNASNASELFACPNVDGGLIGGASLQLETFMTIVKSF
ncbi:MAG: triose-phosphate isomerase [Flavobacteriales bacterium]